MRAAILALVAVAIAAGAVKLYVATTSTARDAVAIDARPVVAIANDATSATTSDAGESARAEREAALDVLRRSGPADESWSAQAGAVFTAFEPLASVAGAGCYVAGCGATLTFSSERAYRDGLVRLEQLTEFRGWTGGKKLTSPDSRPDGTIVISVLLFRPD